MSRLKTWGKSMDCSALICPDARSRGKRSLLANKPSLLEPAPTFAMICEDHRPRRSSDMAWKPMLISPSLLQHQDTHPRPAPISTPVTRPQSNTTPPDRLGAINGKIKKATVSPDDILSQLIAADTKAEHVRIDNLNASAERGIKAQYLEADNSRKLVELATTQSPPLQRLEIAECNQPTLAHSEAAASRLESMLQAMRADPMFRAIQARKLAQTGAAPLNQTFPGSALGSWQKEAL
jgi:hypothetical protein